jgi:hypothetical protein
VQVGGLPTEGVELAGYRLAALIVDVGDDYGGPLGREPLRGRPPDAARRAGDQGDSAR